MMHECRSSARRGATIVEVAVTAPVAFLFILGLIVGSLGAFRYEQLSHLAHEGAAYAAVRGPSYAKRTGKPAATSDEVLAKAVRPLAAGLDSAALRCDCTYDTDANTVTIGLRYEWIPEAYLLPVTLTGTAVLPLEQ